MATGTAYTATTNEEGLFRFAILPVGIYQVTANKQGFVTAKYSGVEVTVGAKLNLRLAMTLTANVDTVVLSSSVPIVESTRTQVSFTVNERSVADLPANGRNFIDFVLLTPGVNKDARPGDISFAGQRGTLSSLTVDGTDNNNEFQEQTLGRTGSGRAPYQFSQDAVQEFQVNTNGYSVEFGRAAAGVVNVITKSGGNAFHGTAFEFFRDRGLNAVDPIYNMQLGAAIAAGQTLPIRPGYHYNQFGGNFGGPVLKNRLFFFFDYDGQRNNTGQNVLVNLPVPANPNQTAAVNYLAARDSNYTRTFNQDVFLTKVDYTLNDHNQLSTRYNGQRFTGLAQENASATSSYEHSGTSLVNTDTLNVQETFTKSQSLVNIGRFSYQRDDEPGSANSINAEALVRNAGVTVLSVGRNAFDPRATTITREQYGDAVYWLRGHHSFKFGGDILRDNILNSFPGNFSGSYTFASLDDFGKSLLGLPVTAAGNSLIEAYPGIGTTGATTHPNLTQYAGFAQDDWRLRSNLTVSLGVRYDLETIAQPTVQNPAALAIGIDTSKINNDTKDFAPRAGFAWQPLSNRQWVLRGGSGIFYGNTPGLLYGTAMSNNGVNVQTLTFKASALTPLPAAYPNTTCGAPVAVAGCPLPVGAVLPLPSISAFQSNYQQPYSIQYNLGSEYALSKDLSIFVGYLGVHGVHLQRTRDINEPTTEVATPITVSTTGQVLTYNKLTGPKPFAGFDRIFQFESNASSIYHGLTVQMNKRFASGFQASVAYTWSHVIDDNPDATAVVPNTDDTKLSYDPNHLALDRASGNDDMRHRVVVNGVWELGFARNLHNHFVKALADGWELSGIFTAQSGLPYSPLVNSDLNGDENSRDERAPGFGRNSFNMPAIFSLDPRITRNIRIREKAKLQLIAEAFNAFNHSNITTVRTTYYALAAGKLVPQTVTAAGINAFGVPSAANIEGQGNVGRVLQLAAKITF
jgi:outer membrane receptor protein involved in Fe transport